MVQEADLEHILTHTATVWPKLAGKTIFLTGGTGFFGKWLLESFIYANDRLDLKAGMVILSRDPDRFLQQRPDYKHNAVSFVKGDIRNFEFPTIPIDFIIHGATEASATLNVEQPLLMFDTIVDGTRHVLELAREKKVMAILHTSSGAVYGKQPTELTHIAEDYAGSPKVADADASYGEGKRVSEMLGSIYFNRFGVTSKIARCFAFVGPYLPLDTTFAIGNFINDVVKGKKIVVKGDGTAFRSYLYAADLTVWLWHILVFGETCRAYNVGSDQDLSIAELAETVSNCSELKPGFEILSPKGDKPPARYVPDVSRAVTELGMKVHIGLEEAIKRTIAFNI